MARNSYLYPAYVFRDPLLYIQYMPVVLNAGEGVARTIDTNVRGDLFLNSYICKLDEEIFSEPPTFTNPECERIWEDNHLHLLFTDATDEIRKHGWCVIQFYEEDENITYKVFSGRHFVEWITEPDDEDRLVRIGVKVRHFDDLGNSYEEELIFSDEELCFLLTWKLDKTGRRYAEPDLNQAVMTIAYNMRQINGQLAFVGVKPGFKHFVYGESKDSDFSTSFKSNMQYVDRSAGIGAMESQLKEIRDIPNGDINKIEQALDKQIKLFAGVTRMPLSFYIGERESQGLSSAGENVDMIRLDRKKKYIFNILSPYIEEIMLYVYGKDTKVEMPLQVEEIEDE